jgi:DNA-binding NarL/FixJ family response regulator
LAKTDGRDEHITVYLVDDHEMVRSGVKLMLAYYVDLEIVGEAGTGHDALKGIVAARPRVVLLDLQLPDVAGLEVLARLVDLPDAPAVLVLTVHDDDDLVVGAARAGARGYVLKHTSHEELAQAIRSVAAGGHYFGTDVVGALVDHDRRSVERPDLTERELDVLRLLAAGLSNREIGRRLYLSPETVKTHLGNIYRKLGVDGRTQAALAAVQNRLLD